MRLHQLIISASCLWVVTYSTATAQEVINPLDVKRFGWEYVGEEVIMFAILSDVYAAKRTTNRGRVAPIMKYKNEYYSIGMFLKGRKSKDIKPFIGSCVEFGGTMNTADYNVEGAVTQVPTFDIETMKLANPINCY